MANFDNSVLKYGRRVSELPFITVAGRILFASLFILSAWNEFKDFGADGGVATTNLRTKLTVLSNTIARYTFGLHLPLSALAKLSVAAAIAVKGVGGTFFIFDINLGAYLLIFHQVIATPILYDFYNCNVNREEFGLISAQFKELLQQVMHSPIWSNFYNPLVFRPEFDKLVDALIKVVETAVSSGSLFGENEFGQVLIKFAQSLGLIGALLFYLSLKYQVKSMETLKKRQNGSKPKTN